jgi:hypothetical protein
MKDGFVALFAAVEASWEGLAAILCLNVADGKEFACKMRDFPESLENAEGRQPAGGSGGSWRWDRGGNGSVNFRDGSDY